MAASASHTESMQEGIAIASTFVIGISFYIRTQQKDCTSLSRASALQVLIVELLLLLPLLLDLLARTLRELLALLILSW